jgi:hypothetical protein
MKIISKKIRASGKGQDCTLRVSPVCTDEFGMVITAHLNSEYKGIGNKSPDLFVVHACCHCHVLLDSSKVDYEDQQRANQETLMRLFKMGLIKVPA